MYARPLPLPPLYPAFGDARGPVGISPGGRSYRSVGDARGPVGALGGGAGWREGERAGGEKAAGSGCWNRLGLTDSSGLPESDLPSENDDDVYTDGCRPYSRVESGSSASRPRPPLVRLDSGLMNDAGARRGMSKAGWIGDRGE